MKIEVLRRFKNDGCVYGEYYIHDSKGNKYLVSQNEMDIKIITHFKGKKVEDCVVRPTQEVIDAVIMASVEYLKESD